MKKVYLAVNDYLTIRRAAAELMTIRVMDFRDGHIIGDYSGDLVSVCVDSAARTEEKGNLPVVALLPCSKTKADHKACAADFYQGTLFRLSLKYAMDILRADHIFILSAKHGALSPYSIVGPYDLRLDSLTPKARRAWGCDTWRQMRTNLVRAWGLQPDRFKWVVLAGSLYRELLIMHFENHEIVPETPLAGLGIGIQLHRLNDALKHQIPLSELYRVE